METPNIQLYNLFRRDLYLSDGKSLEFMNILDKEYKSGVKEDFAVLGKKLNEDFLKVDGRFQQVDVRFQQVDARFQQVDDRFQQVDDRFRQVDDRFQQVDDRFQQVDARFQQVDDRFQQVDGRFAIQDERLIKLDKRIDGLDKKIDVKISDLRGDLRIEIHSAKNETNRYILGLFLAILLSFLALFLKK